MPEQTATLSVHTSDMQSEAWDVSGFWDRICFGFQDTLRRVWSEEQPPRTPHEVSVPSLFQPMPSAFLPSYPKSETTASGFTWTLVLSDTDNDFQSVLRMLWLAGFCDQNGCWVPGLRNVQVVHTGDWLNKWDPNPHVLDGFKRLQETIPEGCRLTLLNGNHELSILQMADKGLRTPMTADDLAFIRRQNLIYTDHGVLFLHGYPSSDLLMILKQLHREEVAVERFNCRLWELFFDGRFPLFREPQSLQVIGDIKNPKLYFNQRSQNGTLRSQYTATTLQELGLKTVIHGHKPNAEVQIDYEFREEMPGVRMINNDNRVRRHGLGGLLFSRHDYAVFINPQTLREAGSDRVLRKKLRKLLRTRGKDLHPEDKCRTSRMERVAA